MAQISSNTDAGISNNYIFSHLISVPPEEPDGCLWAVDPAGQVEEGVLCHEELLVPGNLSEGL